MDLTREQRRVSKGGSATFKTQFLDGNGRPISRTAVTSLTLTLKNIRTEAVLNGRGNPPQSVLDTNNGEMPANLVVASITKVGQQVRVAFTVPHKLETGMLIWLDNIVGSVELNQVAHRIIKADDNTVVLDRVDAASVTDYVSGGDAFTGLLVFDFQSLDNIVDGVSITGSTLANPVVITTSQAHKYENNQVVRLESVVGHVELTGRAFRVKPIAWNQFELIGEDGTGHGSVATSGKVVPDIGEVEPHQAKFTLTHSSGTVPADVQVDAENAL